MWKNNMAAIRRISSLNNLKNHSINITKRLLSVQADGNRNEEDIKNENWKRRCDLATAYRALEKYGMHEAVCNHLTAKAPSLHQKDDVMLIIPYGLYWSEVTPECFAGINMDTAEMVEGSEAPDGTAHSIHRGIYRYRPDVNSVMHTHSKYSTALSLLEDPELKMYHQNCIRFYERTAYDLEFGGISLDGENESIRVYTGKIKFQTVDVKVQEAERIGQTMQDKAKCVLVMGNHGLATVGETVALAYDRLFYFERACRSVIMAYQTGMKLRLMEEDAILSARDLLAPMEETYANMHFNAMKRILMKEDPGFIKKENEGRPGDSNEGRPGDSNEGRPGDSNEGRPGDSNEGRPGDSNEGRPGDSNEGRPGDSNEGRPGDSNEGRPGDSNQGRPGDSNEGRPGDSNQGKPGDSTQGRPGDSNQGRPGDSTQGRPGDSNQGKPGDSTQGRPGDSTQGRPGDSNQGRPGDSTQGRPGDSNQGRPGDSSQGRPGDSNQGRPGDSSQGRPGNSNQGRPGNSNQGRPGNR